MQKLFLTVLLFACTAFSALRAEAFDEEADAVILKCAHSTEFYSLEADYSFGNEIYTIYMIHNPTSERLWAEGLVYPQTWSLAIQADLPLELIGHLQDLIPELKVHNESFYLNLRGYEEIPTEIFSELEPIRTITQIDDPEADAEIKELFNSAEFVNQVFHYRLDNRDYQVRILHNPEGRTLTAERKYQFGVGTKWQWVPLSWNYRYGIMVNKWAPSRLIDHLSKLTDASWRDWYFNFTVANGIRVVYNGPGFYSYLDTWFDYTSTFR
ncbi:MAG: hypothetical protein ACHQT8_04835 [Chlamydiales bacterium]